MTAPPATWLSGFRLLASTRSTSFWRGVSGIGRRPRKLLVEKLRGRRHSRAAAMRPQPLDDDRNHGFRDHQVRLHVPEAGGVKFPEKLVGQLDARGRPSNSPGLFHYVVPLRRAEPIDATFQYIAAQKDFDLLSGWYRWDGCAKHVSIRWRQPRARRSVAATGRTVVRRRPSADRGSTAVFEGGHDSHA